MNESSVTERARVPQYAPNTSVIAPPNVPERRGIEGGRDTGGAAATSAPAFPVIGAPGAPEDYPGMSLRDYFAAQAIAGGTLCEIDTDDALLARRAYEIADAMLAESVGLRASTPVSNSAEIAHAARAVVDRMMSVYRPEYIEQCVTTEPESLLALVKRLDGALWVDAMLAERAKGGT